MARKKVKLQWIINSAKRRLTLKNRHRGMVKKASELATLCDAKACLVVYSPDEAQPEVWPSVSEAVDILSRFKSMPDIAKYKQMMNQEDFLSHHVAKLQNQLCKAEHDNHEMETEMLMHETMVAGPLALEGLTIEEFNNLGWMVVRRLRAVEERIEFLHSQAAAASLPPPLATPVGAVNMEPQFEAPIEQQRLFMEAVNPIDFNMCSPMASAVQAGAMETTGGHLK